MSTPIIEATRSTVLIAVAWGNLASIILLFSATSVEADVGTPKTQQTLDQIVGQALANNPELRSAEADVASAKGGRTQAGLWQNPNLSLFYGDRRLTSTDSSSHGFSDQIALTQTFEFPGKATLRKAIADKNVELSEAGLVQFRAALAGRVIQLVYRYTYADANARNASLVMERSKNLIALIGQRPKAGLQALFDSGLLKGILAELAATRREAEQERDAALDELNILRGFPATTPLRVDLPPWKPAAAVDVSTLVFAAWQSGPLMKMRRLELAKAQLQTSATRLEAAPDFTFGGFYSLDKAADHDQKIGVTLSFPLPVWNQNQGNIASAAANVAKTESAEEQARRDIELSIVKMVQSRNLIERQLAEVGPNALPDLENLADLADRHYRLGAITIQTFLDTQRQLLNTGKTVRQAALDDLSLRLDLELLCGTMPFPPATQ